MRAKRPTHYDAAQSAIILAMKALDSLTEEEAKAAIDKAEARAAQSPLNRNQSPDQYQNRNHAPPDDFA